MDRLTPEAVSLIEHARRVAAQFGHSYIGPEHLLLAFAECTGSAEFSALLSQGLTAEALNNRVEAMFGRKARHLLDLRFNSSLKRILLAAQDMVTIQQPLISSELLFALLMTEGGSVIDDVLRPFHLPGQDFAMPFALTIDKLGEEVMRPLILPHRDSDSVSSASLINSPDDCPSATPLEKHLNAGIGSAADPSLPAFSFSIPMAQGDFNDAANFAVLFARLNAATFNFASRRIDPISLLVGLALERGGAAGKILREQGVTVNTLRIETGDSIARKSGPKDLECLLFDGEVRRIFGGARKISRKNKQPFVTSVHLLEAILCSPSSGAKSAVACLVSDAGQLRAHLSSCNLEVHEGSPHELDLNHQLMRVMQGGETVPAHLLPELLCGTLKAAPVQNFDLSNLSSKAQTVMELAMKEYSSMRCQKFAARHIFLGLLMLGSSSAATYLSRWGLTASQFKRRLSEFESKTTPPNVVSELDEAVSNILAYALVFAKACGSHQAEVTHLLWAILKSDDLILRGLLERMGADWQELTVGVTKLCFQKSYPAVPFSPRFATITKSGLLIYSMVCEPSVAKAMQVAMHTAEDVGADAISGGFLLFGLLLAPGAGSAVLSSLGLDNGALYFAIKQYLQLNDNAPTNDIDFSPELESVFYKGLALSIKRRRDALDTGFLLAGLIESENAEVNALLRLSNIEPQAVLDRLDEQRRVNAEESQAAVTLIQLLSAMTLPPSEELKDVFEIAVETLQYNETANLNILLLIYALSHQHAGVIAAKLHSCGLAHAFLKDQIELGSTRQDMPQIAEQLHKESIFSALKEAENLAGQLGSGQLRCEHLMLGILEICQKSGLKALLNALELDVQSLYMQLFVKEQLSDRALRLKFGDELTQRMETLDLASMAVLVNAGVLAATQGANFIGCEHLLIAIAKCSNNDLVTQMVKFRLEGDKVEDLWLNKFSSRAIEYSPTPMSCSWRVKELFDQSQVLATMAGYETVSVVQLLLALLQSQNGLVSILLTEMDVDTNSLISYLQELSACLAPVISVEPGPSMDPVVDSLPDESVVRAGEDKEGENPAANPAATPPEQPIKDDFDLPLMVGETEAIFFTAKNIAEAGPALAGGPSIYIEPCHILLAFLKSPIYTGLTGANALPAEVAAIENNLSDKAGDLGQSAISKLPFSPATKSLIAEAMEQAKIYARHKGRILPEHLLLAILDQPDQHCSAILLNLAADAHAAKLRIVGYINERDRKS